MWRCWVTEADARSAGAKLNYDGVMYRVSAVAITETPPLSGPIGNSQALFMARQGGRLRVGSPPMTYPLLPLPARSLASTFTQPARSSRAAS